MHAILLVGGRGTRLQPLTDTRPKPMLPIVDEPFLAHQLAHLRRHGVTHVTFACGFLPQQIIEWFGQGERIGMDLSYVIEPAPLDTGGAIGFAARTLDAQRLIVCNGDVLTDLDLGALIAFHESRGAVGTIALTPVDDPSRYGLVRTGVDGEVRAFVEKPPPEEADTNLINAGTYVVEPALVARIPGEGRCNIEREVFPALVGDGLYAMASDAYWKDIGTFPSYLAANVDMLRGRIAGAGAFGAVGGGGRLRAQVDPTATVSPDAVLHAPCYVGPGAQVRGGAVVGPDTVLGAGAQVHEGARVERSVVLERARVGREAQVVASVVGEDAAVSARASVLDGAVVAPAGEIGPVVVRGCGG